jgi:hypothetical protein
MNRFTRQRLLGLLLFAAASALAVWAHLRGRGTLAYWDHLTGWGLLGVMLVLAAYNGRKKLPFLPLGTSEGWLQFHLYAGLFTGTLFLVHVDFRRPTGWFEGVLTVLYAVVMVSGLVGLAMTRVFPRRLTTRGGEVLFERIPALRHALAARAEALVLESIPAGGGSVLAELYERRLRAFLAAPRHWWAHLLDSRRPLQQLLAELEETRRYLDEAGRATLAQLERLVREKDGLDYHRALQGALKWWLFVHVPFTWSLLLFTAAHVVIIHAFSGGAQ